MTTRTAEASPLIYARVTGLRAPQVIEVRRLNYGRYEDNTFRIMGSYNVDLSFGGCAANIQR